MLKPADKKSDHHKNIAHGFFLSIGTTIAEPHTILPLIVNFFGGGPIIIGLFSSLLRGGAIIIQMYAAFHAQTYPKMLRYFRRVLLARFLSWFFIGVGILYLGNSNHNLTLWLIGVGLFIFSFSAGFGAIYFREILAKLFSHKFRGKTMSMRQFFSGLGALMSGLVAGYILQTYEAPFSFGILFVASSLLMGLGYIAIATVDEPIKTNLRKKEQSFKLFLKNSGKMLADDRELKIHIATYTLAFSYLFALPFVIVDASSRFELDGATIGLLITSQMTGAMISNILWAKLSSRSLNKLISNITIVMSIFAIVLSLFAVSLWWYFVIFFIIGASMDGNRISSGNMILLIAPEDKRPIYTALKTNIISLGMFFSIFGGVILNFTSYNFLYIFTIILLFVALYFSKKQIDDSIGENRAK